jgi:hypothetical protein
LDLSQLASTIERYVDGYPARCSTEIHWRAPLVGAARRRQRR